MLKLSVGVSTAIFRKTPSFGWQVLLIKRGKAPGSNLWALPGGHVDPEQSLLENAKREVEEETCFNVVRDLKFSTLPVSTYDAFYHIDRVVASSKDAKKHFLVVTYCAMVNEKSEFLDTNTKLFIPQKCIQEKDAIDIQFTSLNHDWLEESNHKNLCSKYDILDSVPDAVKRAYQCIKHDIIKFEQIH